MRKSFTCVICPNGCRLEVEIDGERIVSGQVISVPVVRSMPRRR